MRAALAWVEARRPARPITCRVDGRNLASLRVAETLGFAPLACSIYNEKWVVVMERVAPGG